ncbi:hypothetical protein [uncultured Ramlibacter sp.]|uniref:hypothetical protein n=1 Tax=uncultured Ramlibacter sp. TaxID=260755 RepID=UPI00260F6F5C|nr:hypothetical protein [uncultured Ramlibacter sp.]
MATIVNARDVLLQAAVSRLNTATLPANMPVDFSNVIGGTRPANNADVTVTAINGSISVTGGGITLSGGGAIKGGQTAYDTGTGFFLGYSSSTYRFSIGNSSGNKLTWNGSTLSVVGAITGASSISIGSGAFLVTGLGLAYAAQLSGGNGDFYNGDALASTASSAVKGTNTGPSAPGVHGYSSYTSGNGHGVRGENANGSSGLVGPANGYDFYAEGSGTNYGPFTGSHDALVPIGTAVQVGQILVDVAVVERGGISSTICEVALSTTAGQPGAIGVASIVPRALNELIPNAFIDFTAGTDANGNPSPKSSYLAACFTYEHLAINAVGEGQVLVCNEGGDLAIGDLIVTSSTAGTGMKQADDIVRANTVARCREAVTFSGPGDIKTVACIYVCG